ncbi:hypothetical protein BZJ17_05245 [Salinivibrio sp. IB574]|uniref:DUF6088 family protein n=1 Tax=Salinivibrio sp. IB574 TaxID=1909444 RepID=UPI000989580C|nr:DUF6088 family protein [Salinivibrio sp. IB574]OOF22924.1 hypothetical protein BZJ17_05245 [Salinivibrio sp. IB574]
MTFRTDTSTGKRPQKISELVTNYVNQRHFGKPFTLHQVACKYSLSNEERQAASKALQRLISNNKVARLANGTYYRPKVSRFGPLPLETSEIVKLVTKSKNATVVPAGAAAVNQLGLDTQLPMVTSYYVSVRTRAQLTQKSVKFEYKESLHYFADHFKVADKDTKRTALLMWSALSYLEKSATSLYATELTKKFQEAFDPASQVKFISALPPSMAWAKEFFKPVALIRTQS